MAAGIVCVARLKESQSVSWPYRREMEGNGDTCSHYHRINIIIIIIVIGPQSRSPFLLRPRRYFEMSRSCRESSQVNCDLVDLIGALLMTRKSKHIVALVT